MYKNKIVLNLNPGDIVVFNANMYHRGVKFTKGKNRRLLQVFDIFPTQKLYEENIHKFRTVDTSNGKFAKKNLLYYIAQIDWLINIVNSIILFLIYYDIQYKISFKDLPPWEKLNTYISYEPSGRVYYKDGLKDDINVNVIFIKSLIIKYSQYYLYLFLLGIILLLLFILNIKTIKKVFI